MGPGGIRPRRRSLALDEAAAAESRGAIAGENGDDADGEAGEGVQEVGDGEKGSDEERAKSASGVGSKLAAKFTAKGKGAVAVTKGKGRAKKKEEEIGPSGLKYTPLEKQFMEIKAENKDVLLLMEVGYKYK